MQLAAARPLMLYDGACGFCRRWVERWKARTGDRVRYRPYQQGHPVFLSRRALRRATHLIAPDGLYRGAHAVFRALAEAPGGRWWLRAYQHVPLFSTVTEAAYGQIARHRQLASRLSRFFVGPDLRPSRYQFARRVFFGALGFSSFVAFTSFGLQVLGLIGERGISPAKDFLARVGPALGERKWADLPTLFWLNSSDEALVGACVLGAVLSLCVAAQLAWGPVLIALWALYLSLSNVGDVFLSYQWDALLLEALMVSALLAPWIPRRNLLGDEPSRLARVLGVWLLFKLNFLSGLVKLLSGDQTWRDLSALEYHYWSQPLPNPLSPLMDRLPATFHAGGALFMYAAELVAPVLLFGPRRVRLVGAGMLAALQLSIVTTGNYGFFNVLTLALCTLAVDDRAWATLLPRGLRPELSEDGGGGFTRTHPLRAGLGLAVFVLMSAPMFRTVRPQWLPDFLSRALTTLNPFRTFNSYGLFAVMTTERQEIELEGSQDGAHWQRYQFRYKPSPGDTSLPLAPLHMPRLDWQMWFAALSSCRHNPWFLQLQKRLLEGAAPEVSRLFLRDPFAGGPPPKFLRTRTFDVKFRHGGAGEGVWRSEELGPYCPSLALHEGRLLIVQ